MFFSAAVKHRLLTENPFDGIPTANMAVTSRLHFISHEDAMKVLNACPNAQWRLIFALCRWGGLRCPSEVLGLKWVDIDWEHGRFTVHAVKTQHHKNGGIRVVPLFPELVGPLQDCFEQALEGTEFCITQYENNSQNLRTQLARIIRQAGMEPWPKLFQNLRSTRETELAEQFPLHVVTEWLGNSEPIASKYYLQMRDAYYDQASKTTQNPTHISAAKACNERKQRKGNLPHDSLKDLPTVGCRSLPPDANPCRIKNYGWVDDYRTALSVQPVTFDLSIGV